MPKANSLAAHRIFAPLEEVKIRCNMFASFL
jgi:hypothetical protein